MSLAKAVLRSCLYLPCLVFLLSGLRPASESPAPRGLTVEISQMKFSPAELLVKKGDTVTFLNKDMVTHDVTEASGKLWKSPPLAPGDSWRMVATQNTAYFCSFHPIMKGSIRLIKP
ncbi:plastocyanin/azurin family copper-binding protein [Pontibacter sp. HJ8]